MNHILVEQRDGLALIRYNRPEKKNALTQMMYVQLCEALDAAREADAVRCVLLSGTPGCFSSGNDVADFMSAPPLAGPDNPVLRYMRALSEFPKPVIAAVQGPAVGVAATTLLHCDLVYAGAGARFQFPFVNLGICLEFAASLLLPATMGPQRAAELILFGDAFDAAKAREYGMVNEILDDDAVEAYALDRALRLARAAPDSLRTAKRLLRKATQAAVQQAIIDEGRELTRLLRGPEASEAISAFLQKRKPDFSAMR